MNRVTDYIIRAGIIVLSMLLLIGCQQYEESNPGIDMPIIIMIPADNQETRVPGDPGSSIVHPLPSYARIYMALKLADGSKYILKSSEYLKPDYWNLVESGHYYRYMGNLQVTMPVGVEGGRAYVVLSQQSVKVNDDHPSTEQDVQQLSFSLEQNPELNLKDLYANPVNDKDDKQNGTIVKDGNLIRTMVCCYHVAAKVDAMWNISPDKQQTHRMTELKLTNLPTTGYFFQPTTMNPEGNGEKVILGEGGTPVTPGNQWYGRAVTYVLQRQQGKLDWNLRHTQSSPQGQPATSKPQSGTVSNAFTAWYRINARVGYTDPQQP